MIDAVSSKFQLRLRSSLATMLNGRVLVQIGTYNANLQGSKGLPQNLVDWLVPSLEVSNFLANNQSAPDIVAIGFQELLPLHLASEYESCFQVARATSPLLNAFSACMVECFEPDGLLISTEDSQMNTNLKSTSYSSSLTFVVVLVQSGWTAHTTPVHLPCIHLPN